MEPRVGRLSGQVLAVIAVSGAVTAAMVFSLVLVVSGDMNLSVGTAFTYAAPGCVQSGLCLGLYVWLDCRSAR
jgi:hypothetical protein